MKDIIRELLNEHGRLSVPAATLADADDLYAAGLTSFAAVQFMLALEERFDVEFPDRMLNRKSWSSIDMIASCLTELQPQKSAA